MTTTSQETIKWAYRLFLDREPEDLLAVSNKMKRLASTQDVRREFLSSTEYKENNRGSLALSLSGNEPPLLIEEADDLQKIFTHIQNVWEHLGRSEPHWSVLTQEEFRSSAEGTEKAFYATGQAEVDRLFNTLKRNKIGHSPTNTCLELGCGLGRITSWLAKRYETVIGYDISSSHLSLAQQYFDKKGLKNILLNHIVNPKDFESLPKVDMVFSVIVLQHNPPIIIKFIIRELIKALNPGGIAFFQVPTYCKGYKFSVQEYLSNEVGRSIMEMHVLPQNEIFDIVHKEQGRIVEVLEDGYTGLRYGERSNTFIIQKE